MTQTTIFNRSKNISLHDQPRWAITKVEQAIGFMFKKPGNRSLIIPLFPARKEIIHMFFVFGPLDIVALDGKGAIVAMREVLRPWRIWSIDHHASAIIELPAGTIAKTKTEIGDQVTLPQIPLRKISTGK